MKKITFIRTNSYGSEPRLIREYEVALSRFDCSIISWNREFCYKHKIKKMAVFNLKAPYGGIQYFLLFPLWAVFCFIKLCKYNPDIIHACDSEGVMSAFIFAKVMRRKIIFDIWDATECRVPNNLPLLGRIASALDRFLIRHCDVTLMPDIERLDQIGFKQECNCVVIPNSERFKNQKSVTKISFENQKELHLVYVGTIVEVDRGLELLIKAAKALPAIKVSIAGYGPAEQALRRVAKEGRIDNVTFLGRVDHEEAMELNRDCDIMVSLLNPKFRNYKYASSSKIFEAFSTIKPIITTADTASGNLVEQFDWGVAIGFNYYDLTKTLKEILLGKISFMLDQQKVKRYDWSQVQNELLDTYNSLLT